MLRYRAKLKQPARLLRRQPTEAEQVLWTRVRRKQIGGVQFYRQKPIGPYIVDFHAPAAQLVIEVDGSQHFEPEHAGQDAARDAYLEALGLTVLRFDNRPRRRPWWRRSGVWWSIDQELANHHRLEIPPNPPLAKGGTRHPRPRRQYVGQREGSWNQGRSGTYLSGNYLILPIPLAAAVNPRIQPAPGSAPNARAARADEPLPQQRDVAPRRPAIACCPVGNVGNGRTQWVTLAVFRLRPQMAELPARHNLGMIQPDQVPPTQNRHTSLNAHSPRG